MSAAQYPVRVDPPDARWVDDRFEVEVRVSNDADRALLVVDEIRAIEWDATTHTLKLWLGVGKGASGGTCRVRSLPRTRQVPQAETVAFTVSLPPELWRLTPHADGNATVEHIDLRQVEQVEAHVTVADGPFYPPSSKLDAPAQAPWGHITTTRARVRTPRPSK